MIKIETVGKPYMNYLYKCIPLAFDESMSYWEQVSSLAYYLINEVMPTINNNANALAELQEYVYNIDLQDEVDNKLDEMYENGQLEAIISEFIALKTTYAYDSVAELSSATNLVSGCYARTSGFYSYNDGGGALYKIRDKEESDTVDNVLIVGLTDNSIIAELLEQDIMNVKQFGAKGDGETDDTDKIQLALNFCKNIVIKNGTYLINAETSINPVSNSKINLINATLKAIPNDLTNYAIIMLNNVHNVIIEGGIIEGEREDHLGVTGEWGHGIHIKNGSSNILLKNITIKNTWGDGLYINNASNINTENLYIDYARRNGISVISCDTYHSLNDYVYNTQGTLPESSIDIEPNYNTDKAKNIVIENFTSKNSNGDGIDLVFSELDDTSDDISVNIINPKIDTCSNGIKEGNPAGLKGIINIENPIVLNTQNHGIQLSHRYSENGLRTNLINPYIKNFNLSNSNKSGIIIGSGDNNWGNVYIKTPYIETTNIGVINGRGLNIGGNDSYHPVNIWVENPLNKQCPCYNAYGENIKIIDNFNVLSSNDLTNNGTIINNNDVNTTYTNEGFDENVLVKLRNYTSSGIDFTFRKIGSGNLAIKFPTDHYCHALSDNASPKITLTNIGDSITIRRISSTEWVPVNIVGTPTISS